MCSYKNCFYSESGQASRFNFQFTENTRGRETLYEVGFQQEADGELRLRKVEEGLLAKVKRTAGSWDERQRSLDQQKGKITTA